MLIFFLSKLVSDPLRVGFASEIPLEKNNPPKKTHTHTQNEHMNRKKQVGQIRFFRGFLLKTHENAFGMQRQPVCGGIIFPDQRHEFVYSK